MRHITRFMNPKLVEICQRAIQLEELNTKVHSYLPPTLRDQCQVGSFNNGCLIIVALDAVWASQLRYALPELRDKLRSEAGIYQLASIKVTVGITPQPATHPKPKKNGMLSAKAREVIKSGTEQCSYEPLREALKHLLED